MCGCAFSSYPAPTAARSIIRAKPRAVNGVLRPKRRSRRRCVDPILDTLDESARHMAGYIDPLLAKCERAAETTPFSVGAAGRPLCAHEKAECRLDASLIVPRPPIPARGGD